MPRWTEDSRKKQAERCRQNQPWRHATGPRTAAGKAIASRNAYVHGLRTAAYRAACADLVAALREQRLHVQALMKHLRARKALLRQESERGKKSLGLK